MMSQDDLNLSKSYFSTVDEFVSSSSVSPPNQTFSDEFQHITMELSPIAKSRDSDERHNIIIDHDQPSIVDNTTNRTTALSSSSSSSPISRHDDLQSARKQVGESSSNFIDKIRYAAHKRKVAVTRSRDSLVAKEKEQEQLRSIATTATSTERDDSKENCVPERRSDTFFKNPFKNKTSVGFGGFGVPKVEKRPTTTPFSPLLGSRRKEKIKPKSLRQPKISFGRKSTATSKSTSAASAIRLSNYRKK